MNNNDIAELKIPPAQSDPNLKTYRCPHCNRFLFKGNVRKLNMVCHYCQKFIRADESELIKIHSESDA